MKIAKKKRPVFYQYDSELHRHSKIREYMKRASGKLIAWLRPQL